MNRLFRTCMRTAWAMWHTRPRVCDPGGIPGRLRKTLSRGRLSHRVLIHVLRTLATVALLGLGLASPARAYVDLAPTLGRIVTEAREIAIVEVDQFRRDNGALILKKVRDLKGETPGEPIKHQVMSTEANVVPRHILEWAEPGRRGVLFVAPKTALVCLGQGWYQVHAVSGTWWTLGADRPDLPLAYQGTVSRLADAVEVMLAGKTAVITTVPHGADNEAASFDLALNRTRFPGLVRLQRIRANLQMPQVVMAASANPAFLIGPGQAGEEEIPALLGKLKSPDATVRAESAEDLGSLGPKAGAAAAALKALLDDPAPRVRMSAAAALLRIAPDAPRPLRVLAEGLESTDAAVRRHATRAVGVAGAAAAPLAGRLAALLTDADELTRVAALQAVATLGPAAAAACDAVVPLLDQPDMAADAADALGRIGPAARPALKRLAAMLSAESAALRWAAVRAMAQIGGEDAAPAVAFMTRELPNASEVDTYNMMIYLALLGPVAKDALPAIQRARLGHPALRPATMWAIEPDRGFPWLTGGPFGGMMQDADVARYVYEAFVRELGEHLRPAARTLARKIMDGSAGEVPQWAYGLLARFPDEAMGTLGPGLAAPDIVTRERAAVALGYMGTAAASSKTLVAAARDKAPTERERRLIAWCLRQISADGGSSGG